MGKANTDFVPGQGFSIEDWEDVSDSPELTAEDFANARPFAEVFPDLMESIRKNGVTIQGSRKGSPPADEPQAEDDDAAPSPGLHR